VRSFLLHLAAELEALRSHPGDPLPWRRRELRRLGVKFGRELFIVPNLRTMKPGGISLGERVALGINTQLVNHAPISIDDDFLSAGNLIINSGTHDPVTLIPILRPVTIGRRVWCGTRVLILAGVTVGDDVVIGAGAIVIEDVPSNSVVAGVPARVIRTLDRSGITEVWSWARTGYVAVGSGKK
jgi:maltose O-acetyltransferase